MWNELASSEEIEKVIAALKANGMEAVVVENGQEAKEKVLGMIPAGAEVMTMSSVTLDTTGLSQEINDSGRYVPVRAKLMGADNKTQGREKQMLGAAPEWAIGSAHAVTQDGKVVIASNTGSQLPAYVYGADYVVWVIGAQKIVRGVEEGMKRIYEYVLPLESERANKAYGITSGSFVSKLLIVNREIKPGRVTVVIVKEKLGF